MDRRIELEPAVAPTPLLSFVDAGLSSARPLQPAPAQPSSQTPTHLHPDFPYDWHTLARIVDERETNIAEYLQLKACAMKLDKLIRPLIEYQIEAHMHKPKTWGGGIRSIEIDPSSLSHTVTQLKQTFSQINHDFLALEFLRLLHVERGLQLANQNPNYYLTSHRYTWAREHEKIDQFIEETAQRLHPGKQSTPHRPFITATPDYLRRSSARQPKYFDTHSRLEPWS